MSSFTTPIDVYTIPDHTTTSSSPTSPVPTPSYLRSHSLQNFSTSKICVYSASSVASLTNLHPYNSSTFPLQFLSLVYSPSPQQQHIDASALGLYLQTREDRVKSLLPSSGPSVISLINSASSSLKSSSASSVKSSVAKVSDSVLSIPLSKGLLNPSAAEEVRDFIRYSAYTSYGTHHESSGLDEYERVAGVKVEGRNEGVKEWRFWEDKKGRGDEVREWRGRGRGKGGENTSFSIVGVADGLRDDYYLSSTPTSPGSLSVRRIIVECKHRMNGFSSSVPLYDMIQCCVYAVMHGCGGGEILEVFRVGEEGDEGGGKKEGEESKDVKGGESTSKDKVEPSTTSGPSTKGPKIKVKSTPVPLDSPPYNHLNNIRGILVPRLYAISNAVRAARRDVGVRYRLMMGVAREDWAGVKDTFGEVFEGMEWVREVDMGGGKNGAPGQKGGDQKGRRRREEELLHDKGNVEVKDRSKKRRWV